MLAGNAPSYTVTGSQQGWLGEQACDWHAAPVGLGCRANAQQGQTVNELRILGFTPEHILDWNPSQIP